MLFDEGLTLFLWAEAYKTTVYIQNRCPHTTLGRKTPKEVFTGTRLDVTHLRIFESVFYCHVHADTRKKLNPSGKKGLLVGYNETSKQCYKYRVDEYIAKGPKRNYRIYRQKCRQTSAIYQQNKKYKNIKKYKNSKNDYIFEKIAKYRHKIGKYRYILEKIGKYRDQIGKKSPKNRGNILSTIYRQ